MHGLVLQYWPRAPPPPHTHAPLLLTPFYHTTHPSALRISPFPAQHLLRAAKMKLLLLLLAITIIISAASASLTNNVRSSLVPRGAWRVCVQWLGWGCARVDIGSLLYQYPCLIRLSLFHSLPFSPKAPAICKRRPTLPICPSLPKLASLLEVENGDRQAALRGGLIPLPGTPPPPKPPIILPASIHTRSSSASKASLLEVERGGMIPLPPPTPPPPPKIASLLEVERGGLIPLPPPPPPSPPKGQAPGKEGGAFSSSMPPPLSTSGSFALSDGEQAGTP